MYPFVNVNAKESGLSAGVESDWLITETHRKQNFLLVFSLKDSTLLVHFKIACGNK